MYIVHLGNIAWRIEISCWLQAVCTCTLHHKTKPCFSIPVTIYFRASSNAGRTNIKNETISMQRMVRQNLVQRCSKCGGGALMCVCVCVCDGYNMENGSFRLFCDARMLQSHNFTLPQLHIYATAAASANNDS